MNKQNLHEVVDKYSSKLKHFVEQVPEGFDEKMIHDSRVEFKKLRAFLRMIAIGNNYAGEIISDELKKLYAACGAIRTNQLIKAKLKPLHVGDKVLPVFFGEMNELQEKNKKSFIEILSMQKWDDDKDCWVKMLPEYLANSMIEKFIRFKVAAIHISFLDPYEDENIHTIRKHLKDIIYNARLFEKVWGIPIPIVAWVDIEVLNHCAEELGNFNDMATALIFLEQHTSQLPTTEKEELAIVYEKWKIEKADIFHNLISLIPSMQLKIQKKLKNLMDL